MALLFPINPKRVKWSSEVAQSWAVNEQTSASGKRRAMSYQMLPAWQFNLEFPALTAEERDKLFAFYSRCKGSLLPFFYKDAESYKADKLRLAQNTDGSFQLVAYMHGQQEPIEYADMLSVYVDNVLQDASLYTVDRGAIVFTTQHDTKAAVTASYEYYWKVCFSDSKITLKQLYKDIFSASVKLKVVR